MIFNQSKRFIWRLGLAFALIASIYFALDYHFNSDRNNLNNNRNAVETIIHNPAFTLQLTPEEELWLKKHPVVHIGIDRAFPPFGSISEKGEYIGFTADIMSMIEYRLGLTFFIEKDAPWGKTINMAKAGQIDMISALVNTPQRQSFLDFTHPYIKTPTIIINDGTKNGYIGSLENLKGKQVAIEQGSYVEDELKHKFPEIKLIPVKNTSVALSLVAVGKADAYVGNAVVANYIIRKLAYHNLTFSGETRYSSDHSIGVIKSNKPLFSILTKALNSIQKSDIDAIKNYWFGLRVNSFISKDMAIWIASVLLGGLLFFAYWVIALNRTKKTLNKTQKALQRQSEVDYLTGLGNRRKFYTYLDNKINKKDATEQPFSLLFLDLDLFKEVNDSLGHAIGDLLLGIAGKRIKNCIDEKKDFVARVGGDEFIIVLSNTSDTKAVDQIAENIRTSMSEPFDINGNEILVTTSIGITRFPKDAISTKELVINGDQAMYFSKKQGRNCYSYFDKQMYAENQYKANLIRDLRTAIKEKQFELHYQPIINFATHSVTKVEALIRWNHPERGYVSPAEFIPLAEEAGLINIIGDWAFKLAVKDTVLIRDKFFQDFQVTINTSPLQYRKNGMNVKRWAEYISAHGLSGKNIVVEITEGILMESSPSVKNNLYQLRDQNIDIAIDDFGTGYSSLSYLKKFHVDFLKIDQSFIKNMTSDQDDISLVRAIIVMAHRLGIKVIAEGIETQAQMKILMEAGCNYGQGFYFSKAVSKDKLIDFLNAWETNIKQLELIELLETKD